MVGKEDDDGRSDDVGNVARVSVVSPEKCYTQEQSTQ